MQVSHNKMNPTLQVQRPSPSSPRPHPSLFGPTNYWPNMGQDYLSAVPRNIHGHNRDSSGSSVASVIGKLSAEDYARATQTREAHEARHKQGYQPRIYNHDAAYEHSQFDFEEPQSKVTYSMPDPTIFHGNQYNAVDMRKTQSSDDRISYGAQSVSSMSHHNSPATPQNWEETYENYSPAYQQSLQDVFPEQPSYKMNNHRHTLQEQFSKSQQQHLRTNSPTSMPRERSPFKSAVQRPVPQLQKQRTSVSPKELMLGANEVDEQPSLFPERFNRQPSAFSNLYQSFESSQNLPQQYPFVSQAVPDSTPDFPAHMLSMESTNEEGPSMPSSQQSLASHQSLPRSEVTRPDVSSSSGTYSCTYHGCPRRFVSPAELQKHKKEDHRQNESSSATTSPVKNSQAGPHRCDRINPSTGKPCNSVFSRPYDLTRHEDTIHNGRKHKVRCHLCTEEKTFSRNDALTRHMRVVHPDIDWVGKQKRKIVKQSVPSRPWARSHSRSNDIMKEFRGLFSSAFSIPRVQDVIFVALRERRALVGSWSRHIMIE